MDANEPQPQTHSETAAKALFSQPTANSDSQHQNLPGPVLLEQSSLEEAKQAESEHVNAAELAARRQFFADLDKLAQALTEPLFMLLDSMEPPEDRELTQHEREFPSRASRKWAEALQAAWRRFEEKWDEIEHRAKRNSQAQ
jgi:hypothetical protein